MAPIGFVSSGLSLVGDDDSRDVAVAQAIQTSRSLINVATATVNDLRRTTSDISTAMSHEGSKVQLVVVRGRLLAE